ncbi:MAG: DNA-directed RNA polymerase subunit omega [Pirellulales bacterium]|nr:DNA-directed RNA polymerase subunit omega [Pirellulales bacterium]
MFDELRDEAIINKVGGRFRLSTLIQKRLVALNGGSRPLVDAKETDDRMQVVIREILEDKIYLDMDSNLRIAEGAYGETAAPEIDFDSI